MQHAIKIHLYTLVLASLLLPFSSQAQPQSETIDNIISGTGIDKLIQASPKLALAALKQSAFAVDEPQVNSQLNGAFQAAFTEQQIGDDIRHQLMSEMSTKLAESYLGLLTDPTWKKFSKMERASSDPANAEDMQTFAASISNHAPPSSRMDLIRRLDNANRTSGFSVNLQIAFFRTVFKAINPVMDEDMKIGDEELGKMQDEVRKSISNDIKKHVELSYLYAFRKVSDQELESYVKLSESNTNRDSNRILTKSIINAIDKAAERAAQRMRTVTTL